MDCFLGFDPGGAGAFGWCVLSGTQLPLQLLKRGIADHATEAVNDALSAVGANSVRAVGIDAPLFWQPQGDRKADQLVRNKVVLLGCNGGTVNAVNSMRGACLIQGMMTGMLIRKQNVNLPITESHPKALLWLLNIATRGNPTGAIALANLGQLAVGDVSGASDHERDAALGAFTAFAMTAALPGWRNLYLQEPNVISPLDPPPAYWLPLP
jgi:hypothetical protein